jgi:chemotaxis protein MotB
MGMKMARISWAVLAAGLALGGCASQDSLDKNMEANRSLKDQNSQLRREAQELQTENAMLQKQRTANEALIAELTRLNGDMKNRLAQMGVSLDELSQRLGGLAFGPLDEQTDKALQALAAQYPDLIRYDSARGMLRFASDLTFNSGSDVVQESARTSLNALARILTSGPAAQYEVMIMGHTDAQPISSVTAQRHPTNMHLSAHRAISVRGVLGSMGVGGDKMYVAGWGEFRPAVPNSGAKGNTPANRRVEIYLTRSTAGTAVASESEVGNGAVDRELPPSRQIDMTK